jgi:pimeloyl-ACP methyl ester carboxylesterase
MTLEQRIRNAESNLFDTVGVAVDESFLRLAKTRARVRLLSHGSGPPLVLLHGVSLSAAAWAPLLPSRRCRDQTTMTFRRPGGHPSRSVL